MALRPLSRRSARFPLLHRSSRGHPHQSRRNLSTTQARRGGSPLFQLAALSNSRENRWLSKASGIGQIEFSPQLQLIRSSEVLPMQDKTKTVVQSTSTPTKRVRVEEKATSQALPSAKITLVKEVPPLDDTQALALGRQLLKSHHESIARLERRVDAQIRLLADAHAKHTREREAWVREKRKLEKENRAAAGAILAAVAVATGIAMWRYLPGETQAWTGPKRVFGEQVVSSRTASKEVTKPVEATEAFTPSAGVPVALDLHAVSKPISKPVVVAETVKPVPVPKSVRISEEPKRSWSGLFWSR